MRLTQAAGAESLLAALAWPLSKDDFLSTNFRQRAVATIAPPGSASAAYLAQRTAAAAEALSDLNLEAMLTETASERLFVWMRSEQNQHDERVVNTRAQPQHNLIFRGALSEKHPS